MSVKCLSQLNEVTGKLAELKVDVVVVSADPIKKVKDQMSIIKPNYTVDYGLSIKQMQSLRLYISDPRSPE